MLHLFPHWNWSGREGQAINVRCYSNLDSVELFLNGKSLGAKPMPRNAHLLWSVPYEPGVIEARGFKNGQVVLTDRRETTGPPAKLALRPNARRIAAYGADVCSVAVEVQDAQGRVVPTASDRVRFQLTGPGRIIGVGNGDPSCREADRPDAADAADTERVQRAVHGVRAVDDAGGADPGHRRRRRPHARDGRDPKQRDGHCGRRQPKPTKCRLRYFMIKRMIVVIGLLFVCRRRFTGRETAHGLCESAVRHGHFMGQGGLRLYADAPSLGRGSLSGIIASQRHGTAHPRDQVSQRFRLPV